MNEAGERNKHFPVVKRVAGELFDFLARNFPVCSTSDEFYYFPQVPIADISWSKWDDFSPEAVDEFVKKLSVWEAELSRCPDTTLSVEARVDRYLLSQSIHTLREELAEVRFHQTQPSFYLTVATFGLSEALDSDNPEAWPGRLKGLPAFLNGARRNLKCLPILFRELGREMIDDCQR